MTERELVNDELAKLFRIIFERISYSDMQNIMLANLEAMKAGMNGSSSLQIEKAREVDAAIKAGVSNIIDYDINIILKLLSTSDILKLLDRSN